MTNVRTPFLQGLSKFLLGTSITVLVGSLLLSCGNNAGDTTATGDSATTMSDTSSSAGKLTPKGEDPTWAPTIKDEMLVVMEKLQSYGAPPLETLTAVEARKQPTPTTAVMDVMKDANIPMPASMVDTTGQDIPVSGGSIHARIYTPRTGAGPFPVIVYYHGGGWVIADLDTYDGSARGLAEGVGAVVVSVHYRQGPEHKFPTAHNDAFAAYQWVLKNAASIKADPKMIAVAGESAGGNLAANVSIMARDKGITVPLHQLLVYPVVNNDMASESYQKYGTAMPLSKPLIEWMVKNYLPSPAASADPRIALVKANLKGLPPTTIVAAEIDVLQTEGKLFAEKLKDAGVEVDYKLYDGVTHEFFGMATVVPEAKDAQAYSVGRLKTAFNK
ncbi:MAG: alpha/beta hydrolase [Chitinophagaceae bacterium]